MDTRKQLMQKIVSCVGKSEAVRLVADSYNAEILANRLGRMEVGGNKLVKTNVAAKDLMSKALERVWSVCELTETEG
jgi:hypothetical protein